MHSFSILAVSYSHHVHFLGMFKLGWTAELECLADISVGTDIVWNGRKSVVETE